MATRSGQTPWRSARGIDRHTADPPGGWLVRDGTGEPTGVLIDTAQELVRRVEPRPSPASSRTRAGRGRGCLAVGLTGVHEMGADLDALAAYRRLVERGGVPVPEPRRAPRRRRPPGRRRATRAPRRAATGESVVGAVKLMADGALGSRGAALHAPYCDDPGNRASSCSRRDELEARARGGAERGFQVCVHAIGDRANTLVLERWTP